MKKVLLVICSMVPVLALAAQQDSAAKDSTDVNKPQVDSAIVVTVAEGPYLDFGKIKEHDFGKIKEKGGKQTYEFVFKNSGNKPLVITKTIVSCKCVDITYPRKPVMPGGEGKIAVTYNPRKQKGVFHKAIQVYSNDPQNRKIIFAKGEVVD